MPFWWIDVTFDKPHRSWPEGHSCVTTRDRQPFPAVNRGSGDSGDVRQLGVAKEPRDDLRKALQRVRAGGDAPLHLLGPPRSGGAPPAPSCLSARSLTGRSAPAGPPPYP